MNKCFKYILLISTLLSFNIKGKTQSLSFLYKIPLANEPSAVSIDRVDNILIADTKGSLFKYNKQGELLNTYSPGKPGSIKSVEAWSSLNILLFYEGLQEFRFLNRFLIPTSTQSLSPDIFTRLITSSSDNNLWILDDKEFSLKKLNPNFNTIERTTSLINIIKQDFQGTFLKEYQHLVFLSDINAGVFVFDNLGNYIKTLPFSKVNYFNFIGNKLYFLGDNAIHFYDLYTGDETFISLPITEYYLFALATKDQAFLFSKKSIDIYAIIKD